MKEEINQLIIRNLSDDIALKASDAATYKALYEVTQKQLNDILNTIESNEELKALFDKVVEELDKPKEEG
jgi:hypothetical protein|nr:MAG TPA: hypothetical protein [Caudoviricetes sp.]